MKLITSNYWFGLVRNGCTMPSIKCKVANAQETIFTITTKKWAPSYNIRYKTDKIVNEEARCQECSEK